MLTDLDFLLFLDDLYDFYFKSINAFIFSWLLIGYILFGKYDYIAGFVLWASSNKLPLKWLFLSKLLLALQLLMLIFVDADEERKFLIWLKKWLVTV